MLKVAATAFLLFDEREPVSFDRAVKAAEDEIVSAEADGIRLLVFPALTGAAFIAPTDGVVSDGCFFEAVREMTAKYPEVAICPGSMVRHEGGGVYNYSCLYQGGRLLLEQRQLYLSKSERERGLYRGGGLEFAVLDGLKTCIILATDIFYPQVSRYAALNGVQLALCPNALEKRYGPALQLAGVWREVQQNQFFALESCFQGALAGREYGGEPTVHAPLGATPGDDGFLARGGSLAAAELDEEARQRGVQTFDVLSRLNPALYRRMGLFRGGDIE